MHTFGEKPAKTQQTMAARPLMKLRASGLPLERPIASWMGQRFGFDFSKVRIHADSESAQSAGLLNARAFTVKNDIVFGPGEFAPHTTAGRRLLAHELAHVVQQQSGVHLQDRIGRAGDAYEMHADAMANLVVKGKNAGPLLQQLPQSAGNYCARAAGPAIMLAPDQPLQKQEKEAKKNQQPSPGGFPQVQLTPPPDAFPPAILQQFTEGNVMEEARKKMAAKLAHEFILGQGAPPSQSQQTDSASNAATEKEQAFKPEAKDLGSRDSNLRGAEPTVLGSAPSYHYAWSSGSPGEAAAPLRSWNELEVYSALLKALDENKTETGNQISDWTWTEVSGTDEKAGEVGKDLAAWSAEKLVEKKVENEIIKGVLDISIELSSGSLLGAATVLIPGLGEIVGTILIAKDVYALLASLSNKDDRIVTKDDRIVTAVKEYFQAREAGNYSYALRNDMRARQDATSHR